MSDMKLWLLRPHENLDPKDNPWEPSYDKAFGFVIRAKTEEDARQWANESGGDECGDISYQGYRTGGNPWLDPVYSSCVELIAEDGSEEVVLMDYASA